MSFRTSRIRTIGAVGAVLAAGTTTFLALAAGNASADEPGRCTQNVNVREEPDATAKIVAVCDAGTKVVFGEERDGFVRIDDLGGWVSSEFVKADDPAAQGSRATSTDSTDPTDPADPTDPTDPDGSPDSDGDGSESASSDDADGGSAAGDRSAGGSSDSDADGDDRGGDDRGSEDRGSEDRNDGGGDRNSRDPFGGLFR